VMITCVSVRLTVAYRSNRFIGGDAMEVLQDYVETFDFVHCRSVLGHVSSLACDIKRFDDLRTVPILTGIGSCLVNQRSWEMPEARWSVSASGWEPDLVRREQRPPSPSRRWV